MVRRVFISCDYITDVSAGWSRLMTKRSRRPRISTAESKVIHRRERRFLLYSRYNTNKMGNIQKNGFQREVQKEFENNLENDLQKDVTRPLYISGDSCEILMSD